METKNKAYYIITARKYNSTIHGMICVEAIYSNGINEMERFYQYGDSIPTKIYDNE
jgi:S-adenosylmethionine:tRNA-ribosyltransferase-isomerase (queuine synthetase)